MIYKLPKGTTIFCSTRGEKGFVQMKIPEDLFLNEKYIDGLHTFNTSYLFFNTELDCFVMPDQKVEGSKMIVMWMETSRWKPFNEKD